MTWKRIFRLSRPRFWLYLFGPFLIGSAAGGLFTSPGPRSLLVWVAFVLGALFFLFPANLFLYGVNDLFDYETDRMNPKKRGYEDLLSPQDHPAFGRLLGWCLMSAILLLFITPPLVSGILALFLFLAYSYSAPPVRAKARPFFDTVVNGLYILPGLFSYALLRGSIPSSAIVMAGVLWCMGMHAYSAIPDQTADKAARIETIATVLGTKGTALWSGICFGIAALLSASVLKGFAVLLVLPYLFLCVVSAGTKTPRDAQRWYQEFPRVNFLVGFVLFVVTLLY